MAVTPFGFVWEFKYVVTAIESNDRHMKNLTYFGEILSTNSEEQWNRALIHESVSLNNTSHRT